MRGWSFCSWDQIVSTRQSEPGAEGIEMGCTHEFSRCLSYCRGARETVRRKEISVPALKGCRCEMQQKETHQAGLWASRTTAGHKLVLNSAEEWGSLRRSVLVRCFLKKTGHSIDLFAVGSLGLKKDEKVDWYHHSGEGKTLFCFFFFYWFKHRKRHQGFRFVHNYCRHISYLILISSYSTHLN